MSSKQYGGITKKSLKHFPNLFYYPVLKHINPKKLSADFYKKGYQNVLIEGGPTILASFLKEGLIDEIFLTIAPKIFGSKYPSTLTMVEGYLFPKQSIKKLKLLSVKPIGNEIYLRYQII